jgi:adenylate cyclase
MPPLEDYKTDMPKRSPVMTRWILLRLKNAMLLANLISNLIGVAVIYLMTGTSGRVLTEEMERGVRTADMVFLPMAFLIPFLITVRYERPIRGYWEKVSLGLPPDEADTLEARKRLLNEPFFLIGLDFAVWVTAAAFYTALFWSMGADPKLLLDVVVLSILTGLITTTVAFFVFEFVLQRRVIPHLFPEGGLWMTPGTLRIRIRTRLTAFVVACNILPFISILSNIGYARRAPLEAEQVLANLHPAMVSQSLVFMAVGIWLTFLVSHNLTQPLREIIQVLRSVRSGVFDKKIRVTSNDEIGYTGDVINEMNEGLIERDFIKTTFGKYVSQEIRDEILAGRIPLDGEMKTVTVLFADLRNYTPMVEKTAPKEVVKLLNGYFKEMDEAIRSHHGLVLQYIGDEIEAVFGAPVYREDHPSLAVQAALEMEKRLRDFNKEVEGRGFPPLAHGIGIHTGEVVAANIGSPDRLSYTLVGDTVNLASRVQDLNKEMGTEILITEATRAGLRETLSPKALPAVRVKGKAQEIQIYTFST